MPNETELNLMGLPSVVRSIGRARTSLFNTLNRFVPFTRSEALHYQDWTPPLKKLSGLCYSPFRPGQSPELPDYPTAEHLREDLLLISQHTDTIRTYSVHGTLGLIPELAEEYGIDVMLGIWIGPDEQCNLVEIQRAIDIANRCNNINSITVGNESLFRQHVSIGQLKHYLDYVKTATHAPVSCSEQWHIWEQYPDLAQHVDMITAHILPFWEAVPQRDVQHSLLSRLGVLRQLFPEKEIILTEVGWPSGGRRFNTIKATQRQQTHYLQTLIKLLNNCQQKYYIVEAFDQPWKTEEGEVGTRWGIMDAERRPKFCFDVYASGNRLMERFAHTLMDGSLLHGKSAVLAGLAALMCAVLFMGAGIASTPEYPLSVAVSISFLVLLSTSLNTVTEIHEWLEAAWTPERRRMFLPVLAHDAYRPKVSIHVPCYNEPPDMVIQTLDALAAMNYETFEVLVIDNNTQSPGTWLPVKDHCERLESRFRFFHVDALEGFKSGALNYALQHTAQDAEIIGVIDADYCVKRHWLKVMTPHLADSSIAIVQCPQDYRDRWDHPFKQYSFSEYRGFFEIGMVIRNDHNAIIQHGTMILIRRQVLDQLGWANWCICEDAELGLRILEHGHSTAYTLQSCGQGLTPDTFTDFKKQRFRWAYGAVQILKRHRGTLWSGKSSPLTIAQRYYFICGWLPWITEGVNFLFTFFSLVWSFLLILMPLDAASPPLILSLSVIFVCAMKVVKTLHLYCRLSELELRDALSAVLAGTALYPTIAKAVIWGLFTCDMPFLRTPKCAGTHGLRQAVSEAREELFIMLLLWGAALGICLVQGVPSNGMRFWVAMLLVQSLPYLAALIMAFLSSLPKPKAQTEPATA